MARLPFPRSQVYAVFGPRNFPQDPNHKGIDFGYGMSVGLAVPCAAAGVVIGSGRGNQINFWKEVDHGGGWTTRYHMLGSSNGPGVGDTVAEGQTIGFVGPQSGTSDGVHLHFEVHNKNLPSKPIYGTAVDPLTNINNIPGGTPTTTPPPPLTQEELEEMASSKNASIIRDYETENSRGIVATALVYPDGKVVKLSERVDVNGAVLAHAIVYGLEPTNGSLAAPRDRFGAQVTTSQWNAFFRVFPGTVTTA
ncbi:hypothetical protein M2390_001951 [Mycetocola sp. BIGb0189]|uniref:M23 family metallopeptidase n=1 Tax=Mycetocola sp. BIGb0189 TaxID=2940604 RepID=UPI00216768A7|nr:M23 family metallopeptidase [Mycetocola sp. BIGb0189]MCS4276757.1 hypothetical protein [Mycetocola sp. BIGb0189]